MQSLYVMLLGFALGMRHATDADHVVAVSTVLGRQPSVRTAARVGVLWGLGHSLTVFVVGVAIIGFKLDISPRLEMALEFCVALMLMLLGLLTLRRVGRQVCSSNTTAPADGLSEHSRYRHLRPLAIGVVHGLAGSAAVALLVLTQIREPMWAVVYLLVFGAGTTAGMMLMTSMIALPFVGIRKRPRLNLALQLVAGLMSLSLGGWMAAG